MAYSIAKSTVYESPENRREATVSWSYTAQAPGTASTDTGTYEITRRISRTSILAYDRYTTGITESIINSSARPPAAGGDLLFDNQTTTFQNRTRTQVGTDSTIVPVSMQTPATLGTTTEVTENPPNRSVTFTNVSTALRWTTETFEVTHTSNPASTQTEFYQIETTVPTLWALFDSAPGGRLVIKHTSTSLAEIATVTCDTYPVWFPDYGKKMYARPTAFSSETSPQPTNIISSEISSYEAVHSWEAFYVTRQMQTWPDAVALNEIDEFSSLKEAGSIGRETITRTRQVTGPFSAGRQLTSGDTTYLGIPTEVQTFTLLTNVVLGPQTAERAATRPRTVYRTTVRTIEKTTSAFIHFSPITYHNTYLSSGLQEIASPIFPFLPIINITGTAASIAEHGVVATITVSTRALPIFGYLSTLIPILPGVASGYERNAAIPSDTITPPPGIGFLPVPEGWEEAHRAIRYSTVYREAYSNISRFGLNNAFRDVVCPISTQLHRVGTFGSVVDGEWVAGFTGTEYKASLDLDSVTFAQVYSTLSGTDSVMTTLTTGFTFANILPAHTAFRPVGGVGHKYNSVSSFVDGSYAFTSGTDTGTSFGPQSLTLEPNQTFTATPLPFLTAIPTDDPGYIEL